jgi:hypothetical protein
MQISHRAVSKIVGAHRIGRNMSAKPIIHSVWPGKKGSRKYPSRYPAYSGEFFSAASGARPALTAHATDRLTLR